MNFICKKKLNRKFIVLMFFYFEYVLLHNEYTNVTQNIHTEKIFSKN